MKTPRSQIQITLNVDIDSDSITTQKPFGPFKTSVRKLTTNDVYKIVVYIALKKQFHIIISGIHFCY